MSMHANECGLPARQSSPSWCLNPGHYGANRDVSSFTSTETSNAFNTCHMTANLEETASFSWHSTHLLTVCFSAPPPTPKNGKPGGACLSGRLKCSRDREEEEREQRQQQRRPRSREQTELHGRRLVSTHTIVGRESQVGNFQPCASADVG